MRLFPKLFVSYSHSHLIIFYLPYKICEIIVPERHILYISVGFINLNTGLITWVNEMLSSLLWEEHPTHSSHKSFQEFLSSTLNLLMQINRVAGKGKKINFQTQNIVLVCNILGILWCCYYCLILLASQPHMIFTVLQLFVSLYC